MSDAEHKITREAAIALARSLIMRHDTDQYVSAASKSSARNECETAVRRRAEICWERTDFEECRMDFEDPASFVVREDEQDVSCWLVGWFIDPIGFKEWYGLAVPVSMKINKITGTITDLWVEVSF